MWLGMEGNPPNRDNSPSYKQGLNGVIFLPGNCYSCDVIKSLAWDALRPDEFQTKVKCHDRVQPIYLIGGKGRLNSDRDDSERHNSDREDSDRHNSDGDNSDRDDSDRHDSDRGSEEVFHSLCTWEIWQVFV